MNQPTKLYPVALAAVIVYELLYVTVLLVVDVEVSKYAEPPVVPVLIESKVLAFVAPIYLETMFNVYVSIVH